MDGLSPWQGMRECMPVTQKWAYFDHAAVAPLPTVTRDATVQWAHEASLEGGMVWSRWRRRVEDVRSLAAEMIAAASSEIAIVANTTTGINLVAESLQWNPGDNIVTFANEFPSNQYPWMSLAERGVETRRVEFAGAEPLRQLDDACDSQTRLIAVSWVGYGTGWRLDVDELVEIARRHGALTFLDAIQGLGVFPIDVSQTEIDFLAADGHKWMLGPEGAGLLYIRRSQLDRLRPTGIGWNSVRQGHDFSNIAIDLADGATRYEGGSYNMAGVHGLGASLEFLRSLGVGPRESPVAEQILRFIDQAAETLESIGASVNLHPQQSRSGILSFVLPGRDPNQIRKSCLGRNVAISCRDGRLRISPHAYNNGDDLQRLVEVIVAAE